LLYICVFVHDKVIIGQKQYFAKVYFYSSKLGERLPQIKHSAYLINTARGSVLDEIALYDALKSGQITGAALDVFETEPCEPVSLDKDLRNLDNIILTPHIGKQYVRSLPENRSQPI
jgi:lactate dehydrogenase-like 2-hydroxyacid dehydrogenase